MKKRILSTIIFCFSVAAGFAQIVITEIMYNPPEANTDSLEFIELNNLDTNNPVDLSGYYFSDGFDFTFPDGAIIPAGGYMIVAIDSVAFENNFGMMAYQWDSNDALANGGEEVALRSNTGILVDSVSYDDDGTIWPIEADAMGYSLVLCDPTSDNLNPANWTIANTSAGFSIDGIAVYAHPGATCTTVGIKEEEWITTLIYPNPSNGSFYVEPAELGIGSLQILNLNGAIVQSHQLDGSITKIDAGLTKGIYILRLGAEVSKLIIN